MLDLLMGKHKHHRQKKRKYYYVNYSGDSQNRTSTKKKFPLKKVTSQEVYDVATTIFGANYTTYGKNNS